MSQATPSSSPIVLRPAVPNEAELIARMHATSWIAAYRGMLPAAFLDGSVHDERQAYWQKRLPELIDGAGQVTIAMQDDRAVGFLCVLAPDANNSVLVDNLHALPGYKGKGAGTTLLKAAQDYGRAKGAMRLHLSVLDQNTAAIGFYESRGWQRLNQFDDLMGGQKITAFTYVLPLA